MFTESHTIRSACFVIIRSDTFQYLRTGALHFARIHSCPSGFTYSLPPRRWTARAKCAVNGPMRHASTYTIGCAIRLRRIYATQSANAATSYQIACAGPICGTRTRKQRALWYENSPTPTATCTLRGISTPAHPRGTQSDDQRTSHNRRNCPESPSTPQRTHAEQPTPHSRHNPHKTDITALIGVSKLRTAHNRTFSGNFW